MNEAFVSAVNGAAGPIETGLGGSLAVIVRPIDRSLRDIAVCVDAPRAVGEAVTATAVMGARAVIVTGRLVGIDVQDNWPTVLNGYLHAKPGSAPEPVLGPPGRDTRTGVICGRDGRFWLRFNIDAGNNQLARVELRVWQPLRRPRDGAAADPLAADPPIYRDLPDTVATREVDLGNLQAPEAGLPPHNATSRPK